MIGRSDVEAAWRLIQPHVRRTPALELPAGSLGLRAPVALKLESLQVSGSFKGRGAFHKLLASTVPAAGIIAASGGNHGAAAAYAARALGLADGVIAYQHGLTDELSGDVEVGRADQAGAQRIGGDAGDLDLDRAAGLQRFMERGRSLGFDRDDPRALADRRRAACYKPAAAHGHQQGVELGLLGELERHAAGAGEYHLVFVGRHDQRTGLGGALLGCSPRLGVDGADLMHDDAIAF